MKVIYLGASVRKGVAEKTGSPYEISVCLYAVPDESAVKKNPDQSIKWQYVAYGYKVRELPLDPSTLAKFSDAKPFTEIDLALEPQPDNPSRNWVVGIK